MIKVDMLYNWRKISVLIWNVKQILLATNLTVLFFINELRTWMSRKHNLLIIIILQYNTILKNLLLHTRLWFFFKSKSLMLYS